MGGTRREETESWYKASGAFSTGCAPQSAQVPAARASRPPPNVILVPAPLCAQQCYQRDPSRRATSLDGHVTSACLRSPDLEDFRPPTNRVTPLPPLCHCRIPTNHASRRHPVHYGSLQVHRTCPSSLDSCNQPSTRLARRQHAACSRGVRRYPRPLSSSIPLQPATRQHLPVSGC